jgi:hypothetical protein
MHAFNKFYTSLIYIQVSFILVFLGCSSLGVMIKHPFLVYFWYLALWGIAFMMATSTIIGITLVSSRIRGRQSVNERLKRGHGWLSNPKGVQV